MTFEAVECNDHRSLQQEKKTPSKYETQTRGEGHVLQSRCVKGGKKKKKKAKPAIYPASIKKIRVRGNAMTLGRS